MAVRAVDLLRVAAVIASKREASRRCVHGWTDHDLSDRYCPKEPLR